jgi:hypothetical protein
VTSDVGCGDGGGARVAGVCGIGATEGAGPTLPPGRAVMWGMEQMPAALAHILNYHHVLKLKNQQARRDIKIEKGTDTSLNRHILE